MSQHKSLLVCPKNLKECIDWVLRATGMDTGTNNDIDNLNKALEAELNGFNSNDLTQLVQGLCLFMGYPSCLCKPKKSVEDSLEKISGELLKDLENYECLQSNSKPSLNCPSCVSSSNVVCKCCVLDCISKVLNCGCVTNSNNKSCSCSKDDPKRCCKDLLEKLKASLSLLNLRADMEKLCTCPDDCCVDGVCTGGSSNCNHCKTLQTPKDYTVTGLGLLRPSPKRLAERLENFFGGKGFFEDPSGCTCRCNGSQSCCCLACPSTTKCSKTCSCKSKGSCKTPPTCPCKTFCIKINSIKVLVGSADMKCCNEGQNCHCELAGSGKICTPTSGQKCCVVSDSKGSQQSVKCMIRRLVRFFNGLPLDSSKSGCSKLCCEIFCVLKCCEFLRDFYNRGNKDVCETCKEKGAQGKPCPGSTLKPQSTSCCNGNPDTCQSGNCCQGCQECDAIKFRKALQDLQYSSPCGQELYRLLDGLLNFCSNVMAPNQDFIRNTVLKAVDSCSDCKKSGPNSKNWQACECSTYGSCLACTSLLGDSKLMFILRHGYSSAYSSKDARWNSLTSSSTSPSGPCCGSSSSCSQCSPSGCSSSGSCPSKCCPDCPQRKAAKIFLGMLPCMYWGLKILYDRSQDPVTWPTWGQKKF